MLRTVLPDRISTLRHPPATDSSPTLPTDVHSLSGTPLTEARGCQNRRVPVPIPDPAVVVLIGAGGSGKSSWAAAHYRTVEIVSSDALRAVVGAGAHDLTASSDAFALLDRIVRARAGRRLTVVVDTLGLDSDRRRSYLAVARAAGLPAVAVVLDTAPEVCRRRNSARDQPIPAPALRSQLSRVRSALSEIPAEGWDQVIVLTPDPAAPSGESGPSRESGEFGPRTPRTPGPPVPRRRLDVVLHLSRFPWGVDPAGWLRDVAVAAEESGFAGIALMDHLIQIPQVDRAWEPIPEPFVSLGLLAGVTSTLRLGCLVSPVTFRPAGVIAKTVATLDVLSGGRAFLGLGAGWWEREHHAFGLAFPTAPQRLDALETAVETIRALWSPGTKAYAGRRVSLPETTCYPRPVGDIPILIGGSGEQRTLRIVARHADACNLPSSLDVLDRKLEVLRRHCREVGRDPADIEITVLDLPVVGADRDDVALTVERLRGRSTAAAFAAGTHAGTVSDQISRYQQLADRGVRTVFLAPRNLVGADQIRRLAPLTAAFTGASEPG